MAIYKSSVGIQKQFVFLKGFLRDLYFRTIKESIALQTLLHPPHPQLASRFSVSGNFTSAFTPIFLLFSLCLVSLFGGLERR